MTERDLSAEWAKTQLEAWADGSLPGEAAARMAAAIAADPGLRAAAERAVAVRRALRAPAPVPMPRGLRRRLLAIPGGSGARRFALPALAGLAATVGAVAIALWPRPEPAAPVDPRAAAAQEAAQDLEVAMRYLHKSALITQGRVANAVGSGLRDAFVVTREVLERDSEETGG